MRRSRDGQLQLGWRRVACSPPAAPPAPDGTQRARAAGQASTCPSRRRRSPKLNACSAMSTSGSLNGPTSRTARGAPANGARRRSCSGRGGRGTGGGARCAAGRARSLSTPSQATLSQRRARPARSHTREPDSEHRGMRPPASRTQDRRGSSPERAGPTCACTAGSSSWTSARAYRRAGWLSAASLDHADNR